MAKPRTGTKLHADEVDVDEALVARLLAAQLPELARRPVRAFPSTGTVNRIFRLGDDLTAGAVRSTSWTA